MESYLRRIASFNKSQIPHPVADDVPLLSFARSGFYLTSNQKIKTFCCDKELVSLATNETPWEAHRRLSPNCTFIQRPNDLSQESARKYGNGPTQTSQYNAIVKSCKSSVSLSSYAASNDTNLPTQHERLPDETVTSPSDSAPILNGDNENRQSPTREFLSLMKQEIRRLETFHDFPSDCPMSRQSLAEAGFFYLGTKDRVQCAFCRGVLRNWDPDDEPRREHAKSLTGCDFIHGKDVGNVPLVLPQTHPASSEEASQNSTAKADDTKLSSTEEAASLAAQIASFREARLCKVCLDEEVNTVFLPCGHLVSCDSCASKLNSCPICRHIIRGTVLAFL